MIIETAAAVPLLLAIAKFGAGIAGQAAWDHMMWNNFGTLLADNYGISKKLDSMLKSKLKVTVTHFKRAIIHLKSHQIKPNNNNVSANGNYVGMAKEMLQPINDGDGI